MDQPVAFSTNLVTASASNAMAEAFGQVNTLRVSSAPQREPSQVQMGSVGTGGDIGEHVAFPYPGVDERVELQLLAWPDVPTRVYPR